jgi:acyl-CoA reductase-like NAD-dependent aldehyde dehydrogenase
LVTIIDLAAFLLLLFAAAARRCFREETFGPLIPLFR